MINQQKSRRQRFLWLLVAMTSLIAFVLYRKASSLTAEPVFSLARGAEGYPVNGWPYYGIPNKAYLHAGIANDQKGSFYLVTSQRDIEQEKRVAHQHHANLISVLSFDSKGNAKQIAPLKRKNGRYVRYLCEYFSVSPSGKHWWTARAPYEAPSDLLEGSNPKGVLTAYDNDGNALQEWTLPTNIGGSTLVGAVDEEQVYVIEQEIIGQKGKILIYRVGQSLPQELPFPSNWSPMIGASLITSAGQLWCLSPVKNGVIEARVAEIGQPARVFTTFKWQGIRQIPKLFWQDARAGLFVFENLKDANGKLRFADGAKAVYRIAPDGTVHKLFETPDVLQTKAGQQVRAGQLLKADEKFVWMEVTYLKGGAVTEYQIVKVPIQ